MGMFALTDIILRYQHNFYLDFAKKEMPVHSCEYTFFSLKSIFTNQKIKHPAAVYLSEKQMNLEK